MGYLGPGIEEPRIEEAIFARGYIITHHSEVNLLARKVVGEALLTEDYRT